MDHQTGGKWWTVGRVHVRRSSVETLASGARGPGVSRVTKTLSGFQELIRHPYRARSAGAAIVCPPTGNSIEGRGAGSSRLRSCASGGVADVSGPRPEGRLSGVS